MTLIDQRILIDAPTETVWQYLIDPTKMVRWHTGYTNVLLLSTLPTGVGVRRRCTMTSGKDVIEEVVAWVEGFGYEYVYLDGGPYRSLRGRFRLQVQPDGTSVQWTITYEPQGLIGKLRDFLQGRREMASTVATSLRQLRREVDALGVRMAEADRAKAGIRGRLNAEERAEYQRRHTPPPVAAVITGHPGETDATAAAVEPADTIEAANDTAEAMPVVDVPEHAAAPPDRAAQPDTQPEAIPETPVETAAPAASGEPPVVDVRRTASEYAAVSSLETTPEGVPTGDQTPDSATPETTQADGVTAPPASLPLHERPTPPHGTPAVTPDAVQATAAPSPEPPSDKLPQPEVAPPPPELLAPPPAPAPEAPPPTEEEMSRKTPAHGTPSAARLRKESSLGEQFNRDFQPEITRAADPERHPPFAGSDARPDLPPQTPMTDTGEISIWDAFGVARPSEIDEQALSDLLDSVEIKRQTSDLPVTIPQRRQAARVRHQHSGLGLRLRLVWVGLWVRIHPMKSGGWRPK